jgi:MFS family permease
MPAHARPLSTRTPRTALSKARWATRTQFLNLGFVAGVWGVHVPSLKAEYALDERTLAAALLATSVGSVLTLAIAGRLVGALGARTTCVLAGWGFCLALGLTLVLPGYWALLPVMLLLGAGESVFDVAINAEGTMLETLTGRTVLSGFHGMFSLGAMVGAAAAASPSSWRWSERSSRCRSWSHHVACLRRIRQLTDRRRSSPGRRGRCW